MPGMVEAAWVCGGDLKLYLISHIENKEKTEGGML